MRGISQATALVLKIIVLIIVILIIALIAYIYFYNYFLPVYGLESHITQLCPEWVEKGCTKESAEPPDGLSIDVNGDDKYLSQLCSNFIEGDETSWNDGVYEKCKEKCVGCPE